MYLVRHGQAGTRDAYDSLSDLGKRQARLLGEHFVSQGIEFAAAFAGALSRQRQTGEAVSDRLFPCRRILPLANHRFEVERI